MKLQLFRSLWGCEVHAGWAMATLGGRLDLLAKHGYTGVEASLADLGGCAASRQDYVSQLRDRDMKLIVGLYTSWRDYECWNDLHSSPTTQLQALEAEIMDRERLNAGGVLTHSNVHSGSDGWSEAQQAEYFKHALPMLESSNSGNSGNSGNSSSTADGHAAAAGDSNGNGDSDGNNTNSGHGGSGGGSGGGGEGYLGPITTSSSHETHRGRPLGNPFVAARLCQQFPALQLTLDASHWMLVCERLLGSAYPLPPSGEEGEEGRETRSTNGAGTNVNVEEKAMLELVVARTAHVHARVGTVEAAQLGVSPPGTTDFERAATEAHELLWQAVWESQRAAGCAATTITPEYGPVPYMPLVPGTRMPVNNVWDQTEAAAERLRWLYRQ